MTTTPVSLLEYLASFDRKERYLLVRGALGMTHFALDPAFRERLSAACALKVPADALVCFDFHLDWLHAGLVLAAAPVEQPVWPNETPGFVKGVRGDENFRLDEKVVASGNQEDTDLLVAWQDGAVTHVLLVEAKGTTGWGNKQMLSKARRLGAIFGPKGNRFTGVLPHFVLCSPQRPRPPQTPRPPRQLDVQFWPDWMTDATGQARWIELPIPESLRSVTRCDEAGHPSAEGKFWRVWPPRAGARASQAEVGLLSARTALTPPTSERR